MVDVEVGRVLVQEEPAGASRRQGDCVLQVSVELHAFRSEDGGTVWGLGQGHLITEQWIREEIEVIAIRRFVIDAAVTFVSVEVDQVWIILAIVETIGCARVALLEQ